MILFLFQITIFYLDHPHEKLPVRLSVNNQQTAKFNITFSKVYPVPNCSAFDNVRFTVKCNH